jgi:DNA-binding Lrp family transcriptional regulator
VLVCIARDPGTRLRDISQKTGLTERAVSMIVGDLCEAGYLTRHRLGARNFYEVHPEPPLRGLDADQPDVGSLLALAGQRRREGEQAV